MSPNQHAQDLHNKITKGFKIYGGLLWAIFLIGTILIPSLNGMDDDHVKKLASRSFVILLVAYYLPYFLTWKLFERKYGRITDTAHKD
ncbi:hypothetical protein [Litoribrevibacter albus]|uniref:Uncharacterized protein n=1 Tax=Litoribrevibacter albus TaxID=1473156 RepID=A0AA37W791_9GAMM|nr:hypothetical protein [Litoribrevibacter albus]GLQ31034.1 hypothetical protein GCM10007876_15130 [Litoribrevibacter albus]